MVLAEKIQSFKSQTVGNGSIADHDHNFSDAVYALLFSNCIPRPADRAVELCPAS